jgi:formylglycine-generating enzyme required for sulfatase activity
MNTDRLRAVSPRVALAIFLLSALGATPARAVSIPTVSVGNPGNAGDASFLGFGAVAHEFRMGTAEITNAQYAEFLNAKAKTSDPYGLYDSSGFISRSGPVGNRTYAPLAGQADRPVFQVSWYDAIRFINWLHNDQGSGDTETGAYTLLGGTAIPSNGLSITRNPGARWFLPNEDEWYKAAYHQPAAQGGDVDDYWLYPTASNAIPTIATLDAAFNVSNPGNEVAVFRRDDGQFANVGTAGADSASFYGTRDQGGNLGEWIEDRIGNERVTRGGAYFATEDVMASWNSSTHLPANGGSGIGFRVAALVPEPGTIWLAIIATAGILLAQARRQRRSR